VRLPRRSQNEPSLFSTFSADSLLRNRSYACYWMGRVAGVMAYQMLAVGVGWQVYSLSNSALDLGLIGLSQFLPSIVLVLITGHVADRYNRKHIARMGQAMQMLAATFLAWGSIQGWITETAIFIAVLVVGAARAFENAAMQALLAAVVPRDKLATAVAANASANQTAVIAGPALGGGIYVAGAATVYLVCAALFLTAVTLMTLIHLRHAPAQREPTTLKTLFAGIAFIRSQPVMLGAISLDMVAVFLGGATALLPIYARDILHTGPWGLGVLRSATAVGALGMALWLARHPLRDRVGPVMFTCVALFGAGTIVFGLSHTFALSVVALVFMGAVDMVSVVIRLSLVQLATPDGMRGRVGAVNSMFIGASNQLGEFESGVTAAWFGPVPAVVIGGIGTIAVAALWMRLFPQLARFDRLASVSKIT
jgi:MFS family permease